MKAFLLAAGYGTRLRPLTAKIPKCLVPIQGIPLLGWWLQLFIEHGVTDVLINTHYLAEAVRDFVRQADAAKIRIHLVHEAELRGSGGSIAANREFIKDEAAFLICYADNLTNCNLTALRNFHEKHGGVLTVGLFKADQPSQCGIVSMSKNNVITKFEEKPLRPRSNLANAGIYVANSKLFSYFPNCSVFDLGKDVLPRLVGKMHGLLLDGYLRDIGTLESYQLANEEWQDDYF